MKTCLLPLIFSLIVIPLFSNGQVHIEDSPVVKTDSGLSAIAVSKKHALIYEHYFNKKSAAEFLKTSR